MLTTEQKDALQEYMNIFTGQSANLLSEMVNKKINLSISELNLLYIKDLNNISSGSTSLGNQNIPLLLQGNIVSSSIRFGKHFSGKAHLLFPIEAGQELVKLCLEEDPNNVPHIPGELTDTDHDALREIGNIILNSIAGGFGNLLEVPLEMELPEVNVFTSFDPAETQEHSLHGKFILIFFNTFSVSEVVLEGAIVVVLSMDSIAMLLLKIDEVLRNSDA